MLLGSNLAGFIDSVLICNGLLKLYAAVKSAYCGVESQPCQAGHVLRLSAFCGCMANTG